jgi:hypothetical protein
MESSLPTHCVTHALQPKYPHPTLSALFKTHTKPLHIQYGGYGGNIPSPDSDKGLVVELPDGKLFKLKNPNGRVVEMPNSAVVEMLDGQVVEVSSMHFPTDIFQRR